MNENNIVRFPRSGGSRETRIVPYTGALSERRAEVVQVIAEAVADAIRECNTNPEVRELIAESNAMKRAVAELVFAYCGLVYDSAEPRETYRAATAFARRLRHVDIWPEGA